MPFTFNLMRILSVSAIFILLLLPVAGCAANNRLGVLFSSYPRLLPVTVAVIMLLSALSAGLLYAVFRRRKAESILRRSREKYRALVENTPDLIMRIDSEGRHLYVSPAINSFFRKTPAEIIGRTHAEIGIPEDAKSFFREKIQMVFEKGQSVESEFSYPLDDGLRIVNMRLIPERDEQGRFTTVLCIFRDITSHRKAERDYRALFNSMLSAFCLMEAGSGEEGEGGKCRFVDVNPAFEKLFGVKRQDIAGQSVARVFHEVEPRWIERFSKIATTGEPMNFENFTESGSRFFSGYAYSPASGRFACVFNEVTGKILAEKENRRLSEQLTRARKMEAVGRLAGGVAHDFNNLLTVILGHMELILEGPGDVSHETREALYQVRLAARRASDLTRQLLAYGRRQTLSMRPMDLNSMIRNFSTMLDRLVGEGITIMLNLTTELGTVKADRGQLEQVLISLAMNSKDAMPEGGGITIETGFVTADGTDPEIPAGNYVVISFVDTGYGMDETILSQVFEPFFTTKEIGQGKGLGLASVHGIIKQHGGAIKAESRAGEGATFRIFLPRGEETPASARSETKSLPRGSETILLVEDEQAVRAVASRILQSLGYKVIEACDASQALFLYGDGDGGVSLLLTDVVMPKMGGWALAERIRGLSPEMRVIFMSGHADRMELPDGNYNFLEKPFSYRDLANIVRAVLDAPLPSGTSEKGPGSPA
ncbi:MAG: PAS domain S-box protein [Deltaproteobacteria bacterium]|nr:PAS domain S-box protein [Deltaproteobacteria bacterium]